jgi:HAE1 family hydrophobic/amphiphilic exporter-1
MAALFIPVTFITGPTGVFYEQFGVTLIIAILISAVNALTLSPALCALLLKAPKDDDALKKKNLLQRFYVLFNKGFNATLSRYGQSVTFLYKRKWISAVLLVLVVVGIFWASKTTSTGFVPNEDRGIIFAYIELPPGASLDRTDAVTKNLYAKTSKMSGVVGVSFVKGRSLISGAGSNYAIGFIKLSNWDQREDPSLSSNAIIGNLFGIAGTIPEANIIFFAPPSIRGFGNSAGFEVNLLDKFGGEFPALDKANQEFSIALTKHPEIQYAQSSFNTQYPQYQMDINVPLAKEKGVPINSIFSTLQGYIGGVYASDFSRFGKQFRVYIQSLPEDRANVDDLNGMYVRTNSGEMAPITQFVNLARVYGPQSVTRFNLFNSTTITGATNAGFSTGDAIRVIEEEAKNLPSNYTIAYSGLTREEVNGGDQTTFIFILSILFVYFLLSAQYESYLLPFAVILSLPFGLFGAYISTKFLGLENNIYFQIALIMLIGLLAKNAILIVEFALQRRKNGESIVDAAINGAKERLRPILMTSFAFILGLMPLVLATGVGAEGNNSIGTGAAGGMLIGTLLGVFVIPILFILFQWLQEKVTPKPVTQPILE